VPATGSCSVHQPSLESGTASIGRRWINLRSWTHSASADAKKTRLIGNDSRIGKTITRPLVVRYRRR
jgi:hypothetical protein